MRTIYKYPITPGETESVMIHGGALAQVRHIGLDPQNQACIWAEVESTAELVKCDITIVGTGYPPAKGNYLGTYRHSMFIWHVYSETLNK